MRYQVDLPSQCLLVAYVHCEASLIVLAVDILVVDKDITVRQRLV